MERLGDVRLNRRTMLGGLVVAAGGLVLTACGGGGGASAGGAPPSAAAGTPTTLTADEKQTLLSMIGPVDAAHSGSGLTWKLGGAFPFTGPAAYYEQIEGDGLRLAAQHIPQLGGPTIQVDFQNIGGAAGVDTQKAVDAVLAFNDAGEGGAITMGYNASGSLNPGVAKYQILSIDPGAGVGAFPGKPYFWGMRNNYPQDNVAVNLAHVKATKPDARTTTVVYFTGAANEGTLNLCLDRVKQAGFEVLGTALLPQGTTDWSTALTTIRSQNPDVVSLVLTGNDAAYFMKQYPTTGLTQPVYAVSFSQPQAKIAGNGFEQMYFCQEDFLPDNPTNEWQKIFTKYYRQSFTDQPSTPASPMNLSAAYYGAGFLMWELARRVLATGGDVNKGEQLQSALTSKPTFPSIFGGSGTTPGQIEFDTDRHSLKHAPLGVFQVKQNNPVRLASADSSGIDFQMVKT
jgi:ABC-type branched-subunit amino acid transport system substrate-binding protein